MPNVQGLAVLLFGLNAFGRVPALLNFTAGTKQPEGGVRGRAHRHHRHLQTLRRTGQARRRAGRDRRGPQGRVSGGRARTDHQRRQDARPRSKAGSPARVHKRAGMQPDDTAVVLFTSGSEGKPKGVVLSNANLVANAYQVKSHAGDVLTSRRRFLQSAADLSFLRPHRRAFDLVLNGMKAVLYPSPLHYRQIPKLIAGTRCHHPPRHRYVPAGLCTSCRAGRSFERSLRYRRGGAGEGRDPQTVGPARHGDSGRLWRHRMLAGHRLQPAGPQPPWHRRTVPAWDRMAARACRGHPRRRTPERSRPECDEWLS